MESSLPPDVSFKTLEFRRSDRGSNYDTEIVDVTNAGSRTTVGAISLGDTDLKIECPENDECAMVYNINEAPELVTMRYRGLDTQQGVHLLVPNSSQDKPGWLSKIGPNVLYDSVIFHPEFPHLTNDLQWVEYC